MITATGIELRVGSRVLLEDTTFRVAPGDRVGLVGRNGAGKTTLTKVLAGQGQAASGSVTSSGGIGYLPQDPRTGDLSVTARQRILSARGLDALVTERRAAEQRMASADDATRERAMSRFARLQEEFDVPSLVWSPAEAPDPERAGDFLTVQRENVQRLRALLPR